MASKKKSKFKKYSQKLWKKFGKIVSKFYKSILPTKGLYRYSAYVNPWEYKSCTKKKPTRKKPTRKK